METIIELSHRLTSGSAGILVTLLCILSWKYYKHVRETKTLAILSFVFLVAQALMEQQLFGAKCQLYLLSTSVFP